MHELQLETMVMVFIIRMLGEVLDYSGINAANLVLSISFDTYFSSLNLNTTIHSSSLKHSSTYNTDVKA